MTTSEKGKNLIKKHEGLVLKAYLCPAGVWTIGYGHTNGVKKGMTITSAEAERYLSSDLRYVEMAINDKKLKLNQNQFDACVSFIFNLGVGNFTHSTLLRKIRANPADKTIPAEFMKWINARVGGKLVPLEGLKRRRLDEANLYTQA